jgi:RNA polymerase sigma-70 factor, ECF subfamily
LLDLRQLLRDCLAGKPEDWRVFVAHFTRVIQSAVIRSIRLCGTLTPELVDDLVQETYLRLCANDYRVLRDFRSTQGEALYGLIQAVAVSTTLDYFRGLSAKKRGAGKDPVRLDSSPDLQPADPSSQRGTERAILFGQIDQQLLEIVAPETASRDRRIFWLYYRHGFTAKEIAALPGMGLSAKGVESTIQRLSSQLKDLVKWEGIKGKGTQA